MNGTQVVTWQKLGATFASGTDAHQNKNSLYTAELTTSIDQCHLQMIAEGILGSTTYGWNQETQTLTIERVLSDIDIFKNDRTYSGELILEQSQAAGWTFVSVEYYQ